MTGIAAWFNQHNVSLLLVGMTVAFIVAAAFVILILGRLVQRWLTYLQSQTHLTDETTLLIARVTTAAQSRWRLDLIGQHHHADRRWLPCHMDND